MDSIFPLTELRFCGERWGRKDDKQTGQCKRQSDASYHNMLSIRESEWDLTEQRPQGHVADQSMDTGGKRIPG